MDKVNLFSNWLNITKPTDEEEGLYYRLLYDEFFNIVDNYILYDDYKECCKDIETELTFDYALKFVEKKVKAGHSAFITDLITLVIYPSLLKNNKDIDKFYIRLKSIELGQDIQKINKEGVEPEIDKKVICRCLLHFKQGNFKKKLFAFDKELSNIFEDLNYVVINGDEFAVPHYKPKSDILKCFVKVMNHNIHDNKIEIETYLNNKNI